MNGYKVFYKGMTEEVQANTSYEAQQKFATEHKIKRTHEITVMLCECGNRQIVHVPVD